MDLFQLGKFTLNSGAESSWKIDCDALTDGEVNALAEMILHVTGPFGSVEGIPRGGVRLAESLARFVTTNPRPLPHLIVDDVLTTGGSMERARAKHGDSTSVLGVVVFARGLCPSWIRPLFQLPEPLWLKKTPPSPPLTTSEAK